MDAGQLDVLHDRRDEGVRAVGNGVGLGFDGVFQELVDQDGALRGDIHGRGHIAPEHLLVVNHFHAPAAQDIGRPDHQGIADPPGHLQGLVQGCWPCPIPAGDAELSHHLPEAVPVFGQVDGIRGGARGS